MGPDSVLDEIRKGDRKSLQQLYEQYRKAFEQWAMGHYKISEDESAEVYQKAFIAFYYNVKEGKLSQLNSSVKTYLFAIGKNILRQHFKATSRSMEPLDHNLETPDHSITDRYEQQHKKDIVKRLLAQIGEPCKTVLELYYFHDYSMDSIAETMNYKTEQIAAKRKFICLKQLKTMIQEVNA
jgi:RNA polymerase sigma factor (sigma-70 family)